MKTSQFKIDEKKPFIGVFRYAMPFLLAAVLQQFYNTADLYILGVCDSQGSMASAGACGFLIGVIITFAMGLSAGTSVNISTEMGNPDRNRLKLYVQNSLFIAFTFGIGMSAVIYFVGPYLLEHLICVPADLLVNSVVYIRVCAIGVLLEFMYNYIAGILLGYGDSKASLLFLSISTVINIVLDIAMVKIWHMGVAGVAISTVVAQFVVLICSFVYLYKKYPDIVIFLKLKSWSIRLSFIWDILRVGIPLSMQGIVVNVGYMIIQNTVNSFGSDMVASYSVASKLEMYLLIPFISFTQALVVYVGFLLGNNRHEILTKVMLQVRAVYFIVAIMLSLFAYSMAPVISSLFDLNANASSIFISHFRMIAFDIIIYSLYSPVNAFFGGTKRTYIMLICSCVEMSGRILTINLLARSIGMAAVWLSEPIPWFFVCIGMNVVYVILKKETVKYGKNTFRSNKSSL